MAAGHKQCLTAQLLRCCQKLYIKSADVLYNDNVLMVWIDPNRELRILSSLFSACNAEAEDVERPVLWHRKDEFRNRPDPELLTCQRSFPAARKFQRTFVRVEAGMEVDEEEEEDPDENFYMLAVLADLVDDKHILLDILSLESTCERSVVHDWVKSCRRWRCQTLEIVGGLYTIDPVIQNCIDTVVSQRPARDLTPGMYFQARLCGRGAIMEDPKWRNQWYDFDASLQLSIDQHDEVGYDVARDKMIQFVREWAAVMFERKKERAMEPVHAAQRTAEQELQRIEKMYESGKSTLGKIELEFVGRAMN